MLCYEEDINRENGEHIGVENEVNKERDRMQGGNDDRLAIDY